MATTNQVKYILHLSRMLGLKQSPDEISRLKPAEASELIDELKRQIETSNRKEHKKKKDAPSNEGMPFNQYRLGMAFKLAVHSHLEYNRWPGSHEKEIIDLTVQLYNIAERAERRIIASLNKKAGGDQE